MNRLTQTQEPQPENHSSVIAHKGNWKSGGDGVNL